LAFSELFQGFERLLSYNQTCFNVAGLLGRVFSGEDGGVSGDGGNLTSSRHFMDWKGIYQAFDRLNTTEPIIALWIFLSHCFGMRN
jgi:hypothetical protein